ncbi:prolyl oligopeptidase family serine peptidase [Novosphingobium sp. 1949]|uniref:Prolyl oligopeptidase family serine peptidase n=1 Tax=Novosphingobium organovorum TaxID=2930092 RepID=A0ABT0BJE8_9SPHN|nr:prolyl oligopeptidase family serine peptidase [Novosphingobium organovorum]MCJ2184844.1 prolyl oligopeptidase family serine peptidase [Novosphingobium organovorum]
MRWAVHAAMLTSVTSVVGLWGAALPARAQAADGESASERAAKSDPYLWLEAVSSPRAMQWVEAHNAATLKRLEADPRYQTFYDEALGIAGAKDRIPAPSFLHGEIYNFWHDEAHLRGIWRKTTLASYLSAHPQWTTVLDIDALGKAEGRSWVLKGIDCLEPAQSRCLISLSDGGEDAVEVREFDLDTGAFVPGGFHLPRGKHRVAWQDADHLLVATDWAPEDLTPSGYPFIVKRLARGAPLSSAVEVYRGGAVDGGYGVTPMVLHDGAGHLLAVIERPLDTFHHQSVVLTARGAERLALPDKVSVVALVAGRVIFQLDEAWTAAGTTLPAGSLAEVDLAALLADPGHLAPKLVWAPGPRDALDGVSATRDRLLVSTLENVRGRALVFTPVKGGGWTRSPLALPDNRTIGVAAVDTKSDRAFVSTSGFLDPSSLYLADAATGAARAVKTLPAKFDASRDVVEQHEATSSDGTRIPYFVVHRKDIAYDGTTPTILTAYGGFQVSNTPYYSGTRGKLWLERGGAFVLANIRGGGEFGPKWHEAGLTTRRQIVYDDFAAVAKDLIARRITSPRHLGIEGGSNGGLLMGVEFEQHPDLWNAVLIEVPLLDMIRISKIAAGASWQGEYGDVDADPAVRAFWEKLSPYQNLKSGVAYPEPFIFTTTKDDRVGPQHARKFAAKMEGMGLPFYYYENTEGGHGSGADIKQSARTTALTMTYMWQKLGD